MRTNAVHDLGEAYDSPKPQVTLEAYAIATLDVCFRDLVSSLGGMD